MQSANRELIRFLIFASIFLLIAFILLMVQNVIRYGSYDHYNPGRSAVYLIISLVLFLPLIPPVFGIARNINRNYPRLLIPAGIGIVALLLFTFYLISNGFLFLTGYYESLPDPVYARRYFGKEALIHLIVLAAVFFATKKRGYDRKLISGTIGRKEVSISAELIRWIEVDDHYLKIHANENSLIKRTTLDQMAKELKPDFIRIHRKYLVNKQQIVGTERMQRDEYVILKSGERLRVGRSYQPLKL